MAGIASAYPTSLTAPCPGPVSYSAHSAKLSSFAGTANCPPVTDVANIVLSLGADTHGLPPCEVPWRYVSRRTFQLDPHLRAAIEA